MTQFTLKSSRNGRKNVKGLENLKIIIDKLSVYLPKVIDAAFHVKEAFNNVLWGKKKI
jgi:hypothetical protein